MDYAAGAALATGAIADVGDQALVIFGAGIILAGSVFLIRWGFRKAKHGLSGKV